MHRPDEWFLPRRKAHLYKRPAVIAKRGIGVMNMSDQIVFDVIVPSMIAANQKQVYRLIAHEVSKIVGIQTRILSDRLLDNEKQTVSAMGLGIAVPHMHVSSLTKPISVFVRLKNAVDFKAPDNMPVDIICLLLTPERDGAAYLRTLARLSRLLRDSQFCHRLRLADGERAIQSLFKSSSTRMAA